MAHADYNCCAVCASKLSYAGFDASHKETICGPCVANLARQGVIVGSPDELLQWAKETDASTVAAVLTAAGFKDCYYENEVDESLAPMLAQSKEA